MARCFQYMEGIGTVLFERSRRARRINISIKPFRGVRVAVPCNVPMESAHAFAASQKAWMRRQLDKMGQIERTRQNMADHFVDLDPLVAKSIIKRRFAELSRLHGYPYERLTIRNQKTRWGSCSQKNHISLNIKLIRLPARLMDYVMLHELVHTRIKHHGRPFYAELERLVGCCNELEKQLREYDFMLLYPG